MEINTKNRTELKNFFEANDIPTQQQFEQLIDAGFNQAEDGIAKIQGSALALEAEGETLGTQEVLNFFTDFADENPHWSLNLNPRVEANEPESNQPGFNIKDITGLSRLFIQSGGGNIGMGTIEPNARLTVQGTGNGSLITAVSDTEQHSRIFEISQEENDGMLSLRTGDTTLGVRLSSNTTSPSFLLGNVGIGTDAPEANLQVSGENAELKITNTGANGNVGLILNHSTSANKQWQIAIPDSNTNLEFTALGNESRKLSLKNDGSIETPGGLIIGNDNRPDHLETDGAFYRHNNDAYLTVDDNFYIRDKDAGSKMHFDTDTGRLAIGSINPEAPLSISGSGKEGFPDASMHITNQCILFGGSNAGKQQSSAQISAGMHVANSLNIVGMGTNNGNRKIDLWAEGGMTVRGHMTVNSPIQTPESAVVAFSVSLSAKMTGLKNPLIFGQINYNYGNHFKNNNHFIAPVTGIYSFIMSIRVTSSHAIGWNLRLNDTGYVNGFRTAQPAESSWLIAAPPAEVTSRTVITKLDAGDKIHIEQFGNHSLVADDYSSTFEGFLLQALS